jgi:hypothetical protein
MKEIKTAPFSSQQVDESVRLVGQLVEAFGTVQRLTPKERSAILKLRRGAHQVIPTITTLATKHGIEAPTVSGDKVSASLAQAQSLGPLLNAAKLLYETLYDAHLGVQRDTWKGATSLYGMLRNAANADQNIADELKPAKEWFKRRPKGRKTHASPETATEPDAHAGVPTTPAR